MVGTFWYKARRGASLRLADRVGVHSYLQTIALICRVLRRIIPGHPDRQPGSGPSGRSCAVGVNLTRALRRARDRFGELAVEAWGPGRVPRRCALPTGRLTARRSPVRGRSHFGHSSRAVTSAVAYCDVRPSGSRETARDPLCSGQVAAAISLDLPASRTRHGAHRTFARTFRSSSAVPSGRAGRVSSRRRAMRRRKGWS
jgi:hypothetical protein